MKINDFDSLAKQLCTIESLNLHLQHLLIDKESLKEHHERLVRVDGTVSGLVNQISQLQEQVSGLINRPEPEITGPSSSTDESFWQLFLAGSFKSVENNH